jgi:hypothetical protein
MTRGAGGRDWVGLLASLWGFTLYVVVGALGGIPDWSVQQLVLLLLVLCAGSIPGLSRLGRHADALADLYARKPQAVTGGRAVLVSMSPLFNWLLLPEAFPLCVLIVLAGLPLDLIASLLSQFVIKLPRWGMVRETNFAGTYLIQALMTLCATPILTMLVVHLKGRIGSTPRGTGWEDEEGYR